MANNLGKYIKNYREMYGLSLRSFGDLANLSHTHVSSIENGVDPRTGKEVKITNDTIEKLANAMNVESSFLLDLSLGIDDDSDNNKAKTYKIPVYSQVGAGEDYLANNDIVDWEEIPIKYKNLGDFFGVKIRGDSMEPAFKDGGVLVVKSQNDVDSGDLAIVLVNGFEGTFKKVIKSNKGITLVAFNTNVYLPHFYSYDDVRDLPVRILGKVVQYRLNL